MTKIKIAIIDDEQLIIEGLKSLLEQDPNLVVTHMANNGKQLFELIDQGNFDADILLLDISMPVMDGLETLLKLNELNYPLKVVILSSHYSDGVIVRFLDEGACAFLAKNEHSEQVIHTLKQVYKRGFFINDYIMQLIRDRRIFKKETSKEDILSKREQEILKLICEQFTNKEISDKLHLSKRTVEGHRQRILDKTMAKNTVGLVIYAVKHKLLKVEIEGFDL